MPIYRQRPAVIWRYAEEILKLARSDIEFDPSEAWANLQQIVPDASPREVRRGMEIAIAEILTARACDSKSEKSITSTR